MIRAKPFDIPKREVWEAFKRVKANQGAAGVDGQSIQDFEARLGDNLYKLWNRLSSGSYMPPPVRRVDIPKASGGTRPLGIPTVADRVGQEVVRRYLEPLLEPVFHADSYGYRPRRSAIDAIRTARRRCWQYDWVVDIDIKGFFDSIDHELLLRAVRKHTTCPWVLLYIERWLTAPVMMEDGNLVQRDRGTPQGGVISPLLANLFLHYVFDVWLRRACPGVPFERYADDIICHCQTEHEALAVRQVLDRRFAECGLLLHPGKTKVVYCKDTNRKGEHAVIQFDFLGYTFRPRLAKWRGGLFGVSFLPAASPTALKAIRQAVRGWSLQTRSDKALDDLARMFNPYIRGWINYYSQFYKSALYPTLLRIDAFLVRWARRKFKPLRQRSKGARDWLARVIRTSPGLLITELQVYLREQRAKLSQTHDLAKAIDYILKRWDAFTLFLVDGRVCLSNNAAERALRGIALGRKSWMFCGSDRGGQRAAAMYSLIITAKMNDIDPQTWLADVLARIATHPVHRLDELLPWHWKLAPSAAAA